MARLVSYCLLVTIEGGAAGARSFSSPSRLIQCPLTSSYTIVLSLNMITLDYLGKNSSKPTFLESCWNSGFLTSFRYCLLFLCRFLFWKSLLLHCHIVRARGRGRRVVCGLRTLSAPWGEGALPAELGEDGEGWVGEGALPAQGGLPGHLLRDG